MQCVIFILLISVERFVPHHTWEQLHIELECKSYLESFPFISNQNSITASIEGLFHSFTCMLFLFYAIPLSYFVKVYDEQINPSLLTYRREYFLSISAILQVMIIWGLYSVYLVGRFAGFVAAICIIIDFLVLLYFVCRLTGTIKHEISTSFGDTKSVNILNYRGYLCISTIFMTSIVIFSLGIMITLSAEWYLIVFDKDCKWLIGMFYNLDERANLFSASSFPIIYYQYLTIAFLITVIQFDITLICIAVLFAIFSVLKNCRRRSREETSFLLEAETSLASSEYTISGNHWSISPSNGSGNSVTAV